MKRSAVAVLVALLAGCGPPDGSSTPHAGVGKGDHTGGHKAETRLYAAASLLDVLGGLVKEFEPIRGTHVVANYAGSNTLAQQIHEGAAPGVFVSASVEWASRVEEWGLAEEGSRVDLLANSLVVIVPKGAADRPVRFEDLADARWAHLALADPASVPAGKYAAAALGKIGILESVRPRIVAAPDVRAALAWVERGEAPVGIVYATDALASARVEVAFRISPDLHPPIVYPMLLVKGSNRRAHELHEFLKSDVAWKAFEKAGFTRPPPK